MYGVQQSPVSKRLLLGPAIEIKPKCSYGILARRSPLPRETRVLLQPVDGLRERLLLSVHEVLEVERNVTVAREFRIVLDDQVLLAGYVCVYLILWEGFYI